MQTFGTGRTAVNEWKDDTHIIEWYKGVKEREKKAKLVIQRAAIKVQSGHCFRNDDSLLL